MRKQSKVLTLIFGVLWLTSTTTTQSFEWSDWQRYATFCSMPAMPMLPQFITHPLQHLAEFFDTKAMGFLAGGALLGGIAVYVWQQMAIKKINKKNAKLYKEEKNKHEHFLLKIGELTSQIDETQKIISHTIPPTHPDPTGSTSPVYAISYQSNQNSSQKHPDEIGNLYGIISSQKQQNEKLTKELASLQSAKEKIEEAHKNLKEIFESLMNHIRQLIKQENQNATSTPASSFQEKFKQFKQDIDLISHVFQKNKNLEKELKTLEKNHQERILELEQQILPRISDEYRVSVLNNQILLLVECNKKLEKTIDELKKKITQLEISKQTNEKAWNKTVMDFVEARRPKPPLLTNEVKKRRTI